MDVKKIIKGYEEFAAEQYMKIRSQCRCYGELREQIERAKQDMRWARSSELSKKMEKLMRKEIDSVLETLPIQDSTKKRRN